MPLTTSNTVISADDLLVEILVPLLTDLADKNPGVVLEGIPVGPWLAKLLSDLGIDENWCLTLVGTEAGAGAAMPDLGYRTGTGADHAVRMRNDNVEGARRLVVKLGEEARLHSLTERGYVTLGPDRVAQAVALRGLARNINVPQDSFWRQLAKGQPVVPLAGLLQIAATNWSAPASTDLRALLPELNLLPDKALFDQAAQIGQRLLDNQGLLERLVQQDPDDVDQAYETCRRAAAISHPDTDALRRVYAAFHRLNPANPDTFTEALRALDFGLVSNLLNNKLRSVNAPPPTPPTGPGLGPAGPPDGPEPPDGPRLDPTGRPDGPESPEGPPDGPQPPTGPGLGNPPVGPPQPPPPPPKIKKPYSDALDEVVLSLSADPTRKASWLAETERLWHSLIKQLNQPRYNLEGDFTEINGAPDSLALLFTQHFASEQAMGGSLPQLVDLGPGQPVPTVGVTLPLETLVHGEAWLANLRLLLQTAGELVPDFKGEAKLDEWLEQRHILAEAASFLTLAPLATLLANPDLLEAARTMSRAYEELLGHVRDQYGALQLAGGADVITALVLAPDVVALQGPGQRAALLSPLHPLTLWKYAAVADELLAGRGAELQPLLGRLSRVPEPLRALLLPGDNGQPAVPLAYARRISAWVQYQQAGPVEADTNGKVVRDAARKLAILYPMIRKQLRLLVHHPDSLESLAPALRELTDGDGPESFAQIHLLLTYRPGQEQSLSLNILDELLSKGAVVPERIEAIDTAALASWLKSRPAHLLVLPGQRRLEPFLVSRQATDLHPLSLPHTLQYNQFKGEVSLLPRSQQRDPKGPEHPFGVYHDLASAVGGLPHQEMSGAALPRATSSDLPQVMPYSVFVIAGAPAEPPAGTLALARPGGSSGDLVLTQFPTRFVKGVEQMLTDSNYQPRTEEVFKLLRELEDLGRTSLFATISAKTAGGFDARALKGQLGQAVALRWYAQNAADPRYVVISLDSTSARSWLAERESARRNDLLGLRLLPGGGISLDLIEVKAYEVGGAIDGEGKPGEQLRAVARELLPVVSGQNGPGGKLVTDCRREALRLHLFKEGQLRMPAGYNRGSWAQWVQQLNQALDGQLAVEVNLILTEVLFNQNIDSNDEFLGGTPNAPDPADQLKVRRVKLGEKDIRRLLGELPPSMGDAPADAAVPTAPPAHTVTVVPSGGVPMDVTGDAPDNLTPATAINVPIAVASTPAPTAVISATTGQTEIGNVVPEPIDDSTAATSSDEIPIPIPITPTPVPSIPVAPVIVTPPATGVVEGLATSLYRALQNHQLTPIQAIDPALADIGPSIIRLKLLLRGGQKLADLQRLAPDLQREMQLEHPPVIGNLPGTGYVSVEVARPDRQPVSLSAVLATAGPDRAPVSFPAGIAPNGNVEWLNLPRLPHMLIGGTTGSGKTMFLYGLILALTKLNGPETVELVLIDPKQTDFGFFENLPHLRDNRIIYEPEEAVEVLNDLLATELPRRTALLRQHGCRDIHEYRQHVRPEQLPFTIVVIDEFADLVQSLGNKDRKQFEENVGRLAQRTRSVGIHLVVATQRPDMKVIPGNLKNNLDCRVAFRLASGTDSRVILDETGAEDLLGAGDMLLKQQGQVQRLQGFFVPSSELKGL